jgi:hypothetical protein
VSRAVSVVECGCRRLKWEVQMTNPEHLKIVKQGVAIWNPARF